MQRSWRPIKSTGGDAQGLLVGTGGKRLANYAFRLDRDSQREHAREIRMQGTTGVGQSPAMLVVTGRHSMISLIMRMIVKVLRVVMVLVRRGGCRQHGTCARRRNYARELGDQEQAHQETDKARYRPQEFHEFLKCLLLIMEALPASVNVACP